MAFGPAGRGDHDVRLGTTGPALTGSITVFMRLAEIQRIPSLELSRSSP